MISIEEFKEMHTLEQRRNMTMKIRDKYKDRIPVFVERDPKSKLKDLKKQKFLVPSDITFGGFIGVIRKNVELSQNHALFVFVNNASLPAISEMVSFIHKDHGSEDGFLYCTYMEENTFGFTHV
jgi:GABA(A) receptor-associated protein